MKKFTISLIFIFILDLGNPLLAQKPNVILILADDLGWGDLGCYGHQRVKTPNLDNLANEGTLFTNFYVTSPICSPSRAGLMTGIFQARLGINQLLGNEERSRRLNMPVSLDPQRPNITKMMKGQGYVVGHFGKWHLGKIPREEYGIDEFFLSASNNNKSHSSRTLVDKTISFLDRNADQPFYINLWLNDPHDVLNPTEEQMKDYEHLTPKNGYWGAMAVYYGVVSEMDRQIGRLLDYLDQNKLADNTIVLFTSDNGATTVFHPTTSHSGAGSNGPFRGCKGSIYEGGIRVPFILRWPAEVPAGRVDDSTLSATIDFLPTLSAIAGTKLPENYLYDGENVLEAWKGKAIERKNSLMWEFRFQPIGTHVQKSPVLAIRQNKWKLLMNPDRSRIELYDLTKQYGCEVDNLSDQNSDLVMEMSKKLLDWYFSTPNSENWDQMSSEAGSFKYNWPE